MTAIEWTDVTWNPVRGCSRVSPGCENCYAERQAARPILSAPGKPYHGLVTVRSQASGLRYESPGAAGSWTAPRWSGKVVLDSEVLAAPLRWKKPRRVFVNSMSDMFHESLTDEQIAAVFGVMAATPQHTYQVLTKRAERMARWMNDPETPGRVAKAADRAIVQAEIAAMGPERMLPVNGAPGYFVTDRGRVLTSTGSGSCLHCGAPTAGDARRLYCGKRCKQNANYHRRTGHAVKHAATLVEMATDASHAGHMRVPLTVSGEQRKELVHRLVLSAFLREPAAGEQGCHRDGDPSNNALPNLRWGSQSDNWGDRKRHGNARTWSKVSLADVERIREMGRASVPLAQVGQKFGITGTQARNIIDEKQWASGSQEWPLPSVWLGVSVEDQQRADERIPYMLHCPAEVRFLSVEPLLGPVNLSAGLRVAWQCSGCAGYFPDPWRKVCPTCGREDYWCGSHAFNPPGRQRGTGIDWVIVGGESGPGARPFDLRWAASISDQCRAAGVPYFFKQAGASPLLSLDAGKSRGGIAPGIKTWTQGLASRLCYALVDRKGGDVDELARVYPDFAARDVFRREWPTVKP